PELRAVPAYDRVQEHGVPSGEREAPATGNREAGRADLEAPSDRAPDGPEAESVERRAAPAGRARPRPRSGAAGVPHGRAVEQPRREAPGPHARGAEEAPEGHRGDDDLRDARPGRGDDDGGPHRPNGGGRPTAARPADGWV